MREIQYKGGRGLCPLAGDRASRPGVLIPAGSAASSEGKRARRRPASLHVQVGGFQIDQRCSKAKQHAARERANDPIGNQLIELLEDAQALIGVATEYAIQHQSRSGLAYVVIQAVWMAKTSPPLAPLETLRTWGIGPPYWRRLNYSDAKVPGSKPVGHKECDDCVHMPIERLTRPRDQVGRPAGPS
jgi:hypothetical protein